MPPLPVIATSSSHQPWLPNNSPPPNCLPGNDGCFPWNSLLESHLLTQACHPSSSPKSLAKALSHCLSSRPSWRTSLPSQSIIPPLQPQIDQHKSQNNSSNLSNSISSSDLKDSLSQPGSPFTTSCANSNCSMGVDNQSQNDAKTLLVQPEIGDRKACLFGNSPVLASRPAMPLPSLKFEDQRRALSAQASVGAGATKVSKRRSRAASKVPITILSADTSNFRAMVQKLTGIPTSPSAHQSKFQLWGTPEVPAISKPHPSRPPHLIQGLPTLDTSASLLVDGASTLTPNTGLLANDNLLQSFPSFNLHPRSDSALDANITAELGLGSDLNRNSFSLGANSNKPLFAPNYLGSSSSMIASPNLWYSGEGDNIRKECFNDKFKAPSFNNPATTGEAEQVKASNVESLLVSNDRPDVQDFAGRSYNYVDSWLSFDGALANRAINMEFARIS